MKQLLDNVSLFWSKYFSDKEILYSLLEGAVSRVSRYKQDVLQSLVSLSVDAAPTKVLRECELLELEDAKFLSLKTFDDEYLVYDLGRSNIRSLPYIAKSPNSDAFLENGVHYSFCRGDDPKLQMVAMSNILTILPDNYYIWFFRDPRRLSFRFEVEWAVGNYIVELEESDLLSDDSFKLWDVISLQDSSGIELHSCRVAYFDSDNLKVYVSIATPVTSADGVYNAENSGTWEQHKVKSVKQFAYENKILQTWALSPYIDPKVLEGAYGHLHSTSYPESSEVYRAYLQGLLTLKSSTVSLKSLRAYISLSCGVPVFLSSYESGDRILTADVSTQAGTPSVIKTTLGTYSIPGGVAIRPDILADCLLVTQDGVTIEERPESHTQQYKFTPLDILIEGIDVLEGSGADSSWWDRGLPNSRFLVLPEGLMPGEGSLRRTVVNHEHDNVVGFTQQDNYLLPPAAVGDYNLQVGNQSRNTVAYTLFKDFIRHSFVTIRLSESFVNNTYLADNSSLYSDMAKEIKLASPPGSVISIIVDLEADLPDSDGDGVPDILDPDTYSYPIFY